MMPDRNEIFDVMEDGIGEDFQEVFVMQAVDARNAIFAEKGTELNIITNNHHIQKRFLDKRNVTKDKLIRWLDTFSVLS